MSIDQPTLRPWSDLDLEAFHDGELDRAAAIELSRALMQSPSLRARLGEIARADAAVRGAALAPPSEAPGKPAPSVRAAVKIRPGIILALAAAVLLAVSAGLYLFRSVPLGHATSSAGSPLAAVKGAAAQGPGLKVVLSLDLPASTPPRRVATKAPAIPTAPTHPPKHGAIGPSPLSTAELERRLAEIKDPQQRLAVCVAWAHERRQSPALFGQIEHLAAEPSMRSSVEGALRDLAQRPDLRPYARQSELRIAAAAKEPRG